MKEETTTKNAALLDRDGEDGSRNALPTAGQQRRREGKRRVLVRRRIGPEKPESQPGPEERRKQVLSDEIRCIKSQNRSLYERLKLELTVSGTGFFRQAPPALKYTAILKGLRPSDLKLEPLACEAYHYARKLAGEYGERELLALFFELDKDEIPAISLEEIQRSELYRTYTRYIQVSSSILEERINDLAEKLLREGGLREEKMVSVFDLYTCYRKGLFLTGRVRR